jgi:hypothetical protein
VIDGPVELLYLVFVIEKWGTKRSEDVSPVRRNQILKTELKILIDACLCIGGALLLGRDVKGSKTYKYSKFPEAAFCIWG